MSSTRACRRKTQKPHVHTVKTNNDSLSHVLFEPHPLNIVIPVAFFLPFLPAICQSSSITVFGYMTSRAGDDPKVLDRACLPDEQKAKQKLKGLLRGRDALIIARKTRQPEVGRFSLALNAEKNAGRHRDERQIKQKPKEMLDDHQSDPRWTQACVESSAECTVTPARGVTMRRICR